MLPSKRAKGNLFSLEQAIQSQKPSQPEFASLNSSLHSQQSDTFESINARWMARRPRNSLFSLEQAIPNQINSSSNQKPISHQVETFAFDNGVAIELQYHFEPFTHAMSVDDSFASALENDDQVYNVAAFEVSDDGDDSEFNQVEAFNINESQHPIIKTIPPLNKEKQYDEQPAISVNASIVPSTIKQTSAIPVNNYVESSKGNHTSIQPVPHLSKINQEAEDDADALAFAADIEAILQGEKIYEPHDFQSSQALSKPPTQTVSTVSTPKPHPHDIFEQMGQNLAHATAFDLGTFSLAATFDKMGKNNG
ncbi:hypothetical protein H6G33_31210 [Calothrix sp. FACHB-1219]|uniref:hypothetical protein n=1 Tax=unclassified Calothrix TaxID=2619626 RepID=UPI001684B371|nr:MULTISPECIES: hypothetical protein [unclassified Calothrix]MBD2206945.1 hypothetical protein [Calothrix sp. FACHB-168]MBD2221443.1 hypothetical protein [Calothrix sp. FACHB-1219]